MANKTLFAGTPGKLLPRVDVVNAAGGAAYALPPRAALAQYTATGCLNGTFYADAQTQLAAVLALCAEVEPQFIAKTAIHARERGAMKDMPALLAAVLSVRAPVLLPAVFARVIDSPKMLRNFVQILRSGVVGRKSLGTAPKRLVQKWLDAASDLTLLNGSVGNEPSLADIVKMMHPRPVNPAREAFYGWLIGRNVDEAKLPDVVQQFERAKRGEGPAPKLDFRLMTGLPLTTAEWKALALGMSWTATRMNLNTLARHGVFADADDDIVEVIAARLRDPELVRKAKAFPYQVLVALRMARVEVPTKVREALQDALEIATGNVPAIAGRVVVCVDVSGSMGSPVTGYRAGATTAVTCREVAALLTVSLLKRNPLARVLPFDTALHEVALNPRDSLATNAARLATLGGGGTDLHLPLARLNMERASADLVVYVSDNQSWVDTRPATRPTATLREWALFKARNPAAKLVCVDLQPYADTQVAERGDILNVGGFGDSVMAVIARFAAGELSAAHWVGEIEKIPLQSSGL
ncbi:MAG TPA: RNA-binding protein [Rhodanobacteraceae bacterium]|nr:RNA-binding protein [Rhodanobacteraceae bacterium]